MDIVIIFIIASVFIFAVLISLSNKNERQKNLDFYLRNTRNFSPSFTVNNSDSRYLISIDDNRRKILYVVANENKRHIFDFENVISVEILEDSNATFSKSSIRTIGGGLIGGVLGGGVGAIVGGLSGGSKGKKKIKEIQVKILLRNYSKSAIYIKCLESNGSSWDSDGSICKTAMKEARTIADKLSVIIDLIDRETKSTPNSSVKKTSTSNTSIANELEKLYTLKEKGIISEEEYKKLKGRLL